MLLLVLVDTETLLAVILTANVFALYVWAWGMNEYSSGIFSTGLSLNGLLECMQENHAKNPFDFILYFIDDKASGRIFRLII